MTEEQNNIDQVQDSFPLDTWVKPDLDTNEVVNWMTEALTNYFEENIRPNLPESDKPAELKIDGTVTTEEIKKFYNSPTLFKNGLKGAESGIHKDIEGIDLTKPRIKLTSLEPVEGLVGSIAGISFDIAVKLEPKRLKDGDPGYYPIKLQLVLQKYRKGSNIFKIRLRKPADAYKEAKILKDRSVMDSIWKYRKQLADALQNPAQGGLPSLGKKR